MAARDLVAFVLALRPLEWLPFVSLTGVALYVYGQGWDLVLREFPDRTIGIAVLDLVDVRARTEFLLKATVLGTVVLVSLLAAAWLITRRVSRAWPGSVARARAALYPTHALALLEIALLLRTLREPPVTTLPVPTWLGFGAAFGLHAAIVVIALLSLPAFARFTAVSLTLVPATAIALTSAWLFAVAIVPALQAMTLLARFAVLGAAVATGWLALYLVRGRHLDASRRATLAAALVPLCVFPALPYLSREIAYAIYARLGVSVSITAAALILLAGCVIASALVFLRLRPSLAASRIYATRLLPVAVVSWSIFVADLPAGTPIAVDLFHYGELTVPLHQLVRFRSLPYLDILPTHGLIDYVGALIDLIVTGKVNVDGALLGHAPLLAAGLLGLYVLLRAVSGSTALAALATLLLPMLTPLFLYEGYGFLLLGLFLIGRAMARPAGRSFFGAGLVLAAALAFRVDGGLVLVVAALEMFVLQALLNRRWKTRHLASYALVLVAPATLGAALAALVAARTDGALTLAVLARFFSLGFQSMTVGLTNVFSPAVPWQPSALWYYGIPALTLILAFRLLVNLTSNALIGRGAAVASLLQLGLVTCALLLFTRALGRHTEFETRGVGTFQAAFFPIALVLLANTPRGALRPTGLVATSAVLALLALSPLQSPGVTNVLAAIADRPRVDVPEQLGQFTTRFRTAADWERDWSNLRATFDERLESGDTFVELGHQPLAYVLLDRRFPGYMIPMLYTASDSTQHQFIARAARVNAPIVLLRNEKWWRDVDGVPDAIRNYRVYEWAHAHYRGAEALGPFILLEQAAPVSSVTELARPKVSGQIEGHNLRGDGTTDGTVTLDATGFDPYVELPITPLLNLPTGARLIVQLELYTTLSGTYQIFYGSPGVPLSEGASKTFEVRPTSGWTAYTISIPATLAGAVDRVRFDPPNDAIGRIVIRNVTVRVDRDTSLLDRIDERLNLGYLPYLWAATAPRHASPMVDLGPELRRAVGVNAAGASVVAPHATIELRFDGVDVAVPSYIRVRAAAASSGDLVIGYEKAGLPASAVRQFSFTLVGGDVPHDYVLRTSVQRAWLADPSPLTLLRLTNTTDRPITIFRLVIEPAD